VEKTAPARQKAKGLEKREILLGDLMVSNLDFTGGASTLG
jgi:hypothetical protein